MVCIPFTLSQAHQTENTMTDDGSRAEEIRTASCSMSCPYSGSILASYHITGKGFRCCTIGLRLFRVYSASVSELDAGERAARAAATALAVSWSMKIDQCIVLRDTSKAKRSSLPTSRCSSHGTNIYSLTPLSLSGKRPRNFFFQIVKLSAASPDTPPFDPRHRRIGRAMRFMETSAVVKKKRGKWNSRQQTYFCFTSTTTENVFFKKLHTFSLTIGVF